MKTLMSSAKGRLALNAFTSIGYQFTAIICNFILPRYILCFYGSNTNGLINSIAQFLNIVGLSELGVGAVIRTSMYRPLAEGDNEQLSQVIASSDKFFRRIAIILFAYVLALFVVYPNLVNKEFSWPYTGFLILAMSISQFAQYYFGTTNVILTTANQRAYVSTLINIFTLIFNTVACVILMRLEVTIQIVKLTTSMIFLLRPLILSLYVKKNYNINRKIKYNGEPIKQKWNGIAQHIAAYVNNGTDSIILTFFSSLSNVSVYSVYSLIIRGIQGLLTSLTSGFNPLLGELISLNKKKELKILFNWYEWFMHSITTLVFGCSIVLIVPLVMIYTNGIVDADYYQPMFSFLICAATVVVCYRDPYLAVILAGGHYKTTQKCFMMTAVINITVSICFVFPFGLSGVAIGTLVANTYQLLWMMNYIKNNVIKSILFVDVAKQLMIDGVVLLTGIFITKGFIINVFSYYNWFLLACRVFIVWLIIALSINFIFYRDKIIKLFNIITKKQIL